MLAFAGADRVQSGMRNSFGRASGVCARLRAGSIIVEVGSYMRNLDLLKKRFNVARMKVPATCQTVVLQYKNLKYLKRTGLPLYNADKRQYIPFFELMEEEQEQEA
jgi:ribosomal protein L16/L10AE